MPFAKNIETNVMNNLLHMAINLGVVTDDANINNVQTLVEYSRINLENALITAAGNEDKSIFDFICKEISKRGENVSKSALNQGLIRASQFGNVDIGKKLLDLGADNLNTALYASSFFGNKDMVLLLIDRGADDIKNAITEARMSGEEDIVKLLRQYQ